MNNFEKTFILLLMFVIFMFGFFVHYFVASIKENAQKDKYFLILKSQTKGMYIQLENGTLWKKQ